MNHPEAHNLLDERREGAIIPESRVMYALFLTGDLTENELLRVNTYSNSAENQDNLNL